jgi:SAM-dependent methyltransferase
MKIFDFLSPEQGEIEEMLSKVLPDDMSHLEMLDIASGTGEHLHVYLDKKILHLTVIDYSKVSLDILKKKFCKYIDKLEIIIGDIFTEEIQRKFDVVNIGDNSLHMFNSFKEQYDVIRLISRYLKENGMAVVNITPITESDILRYSDGYQPIDVENDTFTEQMHVRIKVDIFNQEIVYYFKDADSERKVKSRILLQRELEDMIDCAGMYVWKTFCIKSKNGKDTYFYFLKLKN